MDACLDPFEDNRRHGEAQGQRDGSLAGLREGKGVGRTTALDLGLQLGFVQGVVEYLQQQYQQEDLNDSSDRRGRIRPLLDELEQLLKAFPEPETLFSSQDGDETVTAEDQLQHVKAKFKLLTVKCQVPHLTLRQLMQDAAKQGDETLIFAPRGGSVDW